MLRFIKIPDWLNHPAPETVLRVLMAILILAILIGLVAFLMYFAQFDGGISDTQSVWGEFGDFVGGTLNPIFALLTLIAILLTLAIQSSELRVSTQQQKRSADAAQKQIDFYQREARRADLYRLIEKLAGRINKNYNENRLDQDGSLHAVLAEKEMIHPRFSTTDLYKYYQDTASRTYRTIRWIENDLVRLMNYLEQYMKVSDLGFGETPLIEFWNAPSFIDTQLR